MGIGKILAIYFNELEIRIFIQHSAALSRPPLQPCNVVMSRKADFALLFLKSVAVRYEKLSE